MLKHRGGAKTAVIFNWRDLRHPRAGGAEIYTHALAVALLKQGYRVVWFASQPGGLEHYEHRDGYQVIRQGNAISCRVFALWWLFKHRRQVDLVIDEVNTLPFLSPLVKKDSFLLIHQLAREVWFAEAPAPIGLIGFLTEGLMLSVYRASPTIALSPSTAASLRDVGLKGEITVVEPPLKGPLDAGRITPQRGLVGYVGRITPSKRIDHIVRAFAVVNQTHPWTRLIIVGNGSKQNVASLKRLVKNLELSDKVTFTGSVTDAERDATMSKLDVLAMASLREGWGLVVSEAARYRVPCVSYAVPGLIDSIIDGVTGLLTIEQDPKQLASAIQSVIQDRSMRDDLGGAAADYIRRFGYGYFEERVAAVFTR